jgi:RNA polymerase sigma factor (sigma-70 family)
MPAYYQTNQPGNHPIGSASVFPLFMQTNPSAPRTYVHHDTEVRLWRNFRAGSRADYERLVAYFYRDLHYYGSRFTLNTDLLNDCVQDLFVDLWVYRARIVDTDYVRPYLYKSLRRKIYRELQHVANRMSDEELPFNESPDTDPTIEQELIQTELASYKSSRLSAMLERLSARQREAIHLKFYGELSNEQIADLLNMNKQSVANLLHRGLTRLRDEWPSLLSMAGLWLLNTLRTYLL